MKTGSIKSATKSVIAYEQHRTTYYKSKAQRAVNDFEDGEVRAELQARIDGVVLKEHPEINFLMICTIAIGFVACALIYKSL